MRKLLDLALANVRDIAGLGGCGLVSYGAWTIYHPAGFIVGGAMVVAGAVLWPRGDAG